jgi:uncharacterized membrane protein YozB (DUF420 family)
VLAPLGAYIQYFEERLGGTRSFTMAAAADAVLLMLTTAIALWFVLRGKIQQHRQWMTRSFAVALVFLEVRVILGITRWDATPGYATPEMVVWFCNVFAIFLADVVLQIQELLRARPAAKSARAKPEVASPTFEAAPGD